jgi:hypothetical protein
MDDPSMTREKAIENVMRSQCVKSSVEKALKKFGVTSRMRGILFDALSI